VGDVLLYMLNTVKFSKILPMTETQSLYELLGGETGVRALVDRFYDLMDSSPEAKDIRALHAASLKGHARSCYVPHWLVGRTAACMCKNLVIPRLRHAPHAFPIGERERDQWLWCMNQAIDAGDFHPRGEGAFQKRFAEMADFMRNQRKREAFR
jgi:hemoglobin